MKAIRYIFSQNWTITVIGGILATVVGGLVLDSILDARDSGNGPGIIAAVPTVAVAASETPTPTWTPTDPLTTTSEPTQALIPLTPTWTPTSTSTSKPTPTPVPPIPTLTPTDTSVPTAISPPTSIVTFDVTATAAFATVVAFQSATATPTPAHTATPNATATAIYYRAQAIAAAEAAGMDPVQVSMDSETGLISATHPIDGAVYVYVPAGEFLMGSDAGQWMDGPQHKVYLDGFWIMRTPVTNLQYARCVEAGVCTPTHRWNSVGYANHPVTGVNWEQANAYAEWADARLPTEAEWEKACHGPAGRIYPWGYENPSPHLANYNLGDTTPVDSFPAGASPYGCNRKK